LPRKWPEPVGSDHFRGKPFPYNTPNMPQPNSFYTHLPAYENGTECSETSTYKIQTPGNHPKESIQQFQQLYKQIQNK